MVNNYTKSLTLILGIIIFSSAFGQTKKQALTNFNNPFQSKVSKQSKPIISPANQNQSSSKQHGIIKTKNGSFFISAENRSFDESIAEETFRNWFDLNELHSFSKSPSKKDKLGFTHTSYQHFYNNYQVEGSNIIVHYKNNEVYSINGRIAEFTTIETGITITKESAKKNAMEHLKVSKLITDYEVETVVIRLPNKLENKSDFKLTQKVRIDSYSPFVMANVYIDVVTGEILNKINLVAHADVPGTGQTLYSGNRAITCDSSSLGYRLRESVRNIETYDATNATGLDSNIGFLGVSDFVNTSSNYIGVPILDSFNITAIAQSWWYNSFVDQTPDLYIVVKDSNNKQIFKSTYIDNTNPPVSFQNLGVNLFNPPYTIEIWDYDPIGGDDFGGSYTLSTNQGSTNWSGSGNNGNYSITSSGNPAIDIHWGMEIAYDFYLDSLNRDSYDGNGSKIKQYWNPASVTGLPKNVNNAFALSSPYNIMVYGKGDGSLLSPVVGLDVEGHEFTHLVINNNGNGGLTYKGESGALNESFADIFGTCIEFYSGVNPDWTIGEDVALTSPFYIRSMSNPNAGQQPDTYNGTNWVNPNSSQDNGGVHTNSGVQNFWFYLLSQGGAGTNDLSNSYIVTGIGIDMARDIAYRNLITYLTSSATYQDAYTGSLQAADDLFGNPSSEYSAVREAWYAVGIGNNPIDLCSGTLNYTDTSGTITDGSGSADYNNNSDCKWVIAPPGATQITLNFTAFDTEADYDTVFVYDGPDETFPRLASWWGDSLPPSIVTSQGVGAMCIQFRSDSSITESGWSANYTSTGIAPSCQGGSLLTDTSGSFNDGSGSSNYGNNQLCYWFISPPCASSVTLSFSQFDTELNYDGLIIYDNLSASNTPTVLSGTSLPSNVISNTGEMLVIFSSDYSTTQGGFSASYTSTGTGFCSGTTILNTSDWGTISDGSVASNYCNNSNCEWLIQPPQATSITLNFTTFDLELPSTDGRTIYDAIEIFDGTTTSDSLLGVFTGNNIPPSITSTGGDMLVHFYSDETLNLSGWDAIYTSTQATSCTGSTTLTNATDSISDGSGLSDYSNNSNCSWLIEPPNVNNITLNFTSFSTELNYDGVIVYDGSDTTGTILGQFSGSTIPNSVTSTGGSMYIEFLSDQADRDAGFEANYTTTIVGIEEQFLIKNIDVYPNPSEGNFTINSNYKQILQLRITDLLGKQVATYVLKNGQNLINATKLKKGVYLLKFEINGNQQGVEKLIIQ